MTAKVVTENVGRDEKPITIRPKTLLKIMQYRKQNKSFYWIDRQLGITHSERLLSDFLGVDWTALIDFVKRVKANKYFFKDVGSPEMRGLALDAKIRLLDEGFDVIPPPRGFKHVNRKLVPDPDQAPMIRYIFEGAKDGKSYAQLARDVLDKFGVRLSSKEIGKTLRNRKYIGDNFMKVKGEVKFFLKKHPAIINEELFWSLQPPEKGSRLTRVPYGFIRQGYQVRKDPKAAEDIVRMFKLWLERKTLPEIEEKTGMNRSTIWRRIKNRVYANRVEIPGKPPQEWPKAGVEPIVTFENWLDAQRITFDSPAWKISKDSRKKRMSLAIQELYGMIKRQPATSAELQRITGHTKTKLHRYLRELRAGGLIERESGKRGKWYAFSEKLTLT